MFNRGLWMFIYESCDKPDLLLLFGINGVIFTLVLEFVQVLG